MIVVLNSNPGPFPSSSNFIGVPTITLTGQDVQPPLEMIISASSLLSSTSINFFILEDDTSFSVLGTLALDAHTMRNSIICESCLENPLIGVRVHELAPESMRDG